MITDLCKYILLNNLYKKIVLQFDINDKLIYQIKEELKYNNLISKDLKHEINILQTRNLKINKLINKIIYKLQNINI